MARPEDLLPADPRLHGEFRRYHPGPEGDLVLVGVVHDHPASVYRARTVVAAVAPDVVALELPDLAVPLYREHARNGPTPPAHGGEMSAAAGAAPGRVVGVDAPSARSLRELLSHLRTTDVDAGDVHELLGGFAALGHKALACRLAATLSRRAGVVAQVVDPTEHDCEATDPPAVQAEDERTQVRRSRALASAIDVPRARERRDEIRERTMAAELEALREEGDVVAVVGIGHLEGIVTELDAPGDAQR